MSSSDLSNQSRLNQNIRINALTEFRDYIGGITGSPALRYDNYYSSGLSNNPEVGKPLEGDDILSLILQSSAEGAYFTRDIMKNFLISDSSESISNSFNLTGAVYNFLIPGKESEKSFKVYAPKGVMPKQGLDLWVATSALEQSLEDVDISYKKISKKIDDGTGSGNKVTVEGYGTSKPGSRITFISPNVNKFPNKIPDRITNPIISAFTIRKGRFTLNSRCQDELSLFFNAIPTLEMSKCAPYLSLLIRYPKDKNSEDNMSLGSFLRFVKTDDGSLVLDEGLGLRSGKSKLNSLGSDNFNRSGVDPFNNFNLDEKLSVTSEAGMELFLSPQTLSNSNIKNTEYGENILEPIMPLMTIQSFDVSIQGLSYGLYASKTATLSIKLHDRSRLKDIKPLVSPEQFGEVRLIIEYGWSHPEGDLRHNNPIGQFLNNLRDVGIFTVASSTFSFNGTGVDINLNLAMMGGDDSYSVLAACGKYIQGKIFKPQLERIMNSMMEEVSNVGYSQEKLQEIRKKHVIDINAATSYNSMIHMSTYYELLQKSGYFNNSTKASAKKEFLEKTKEIFKLGEHSPSKSGGSKKSDKFEPTENGKRLIEAIGEKIQSLNYINDPFIPEMMEAQYQNKNLQSLLSFVKSEDQLVDANWGIFDAIAAGNGFGTGNKKSLISLGTLLTKFVAEPLSTTLRYDEIQIYFYPVNHRSGGARIYNTATIPIIIDDFKEKINEKLFKNPSMVSSKFISFMDSEFLNDSENLMYGISAEINKKKIAQSFNKDAIKKMTDAELSNLGLEPEFLSLRNKLNSSKDDITLTSDERKKIKNKSIELLKEANTSISTRLGLIYASDGSNRYIGELKFQNIDLGVMYETLPVVMPSKTSDSSSDYFNKTILKIHFYDKNYTPDPDLLHMQDLITGGIINPGHGLTDTSSGIDTPEKLVSELSTKDIKNMIKKRKCSFTYGAEYTNVENFSIQSVGTGGSSIGNTLLLTALNNKDAPQVGHGGVGSNDDMLIIPSKASVKCLGMPFLVRGQEMYVDMNSGTTADNMYVITSVKHSIKDTFSSTFELTYVGANSIKDIRKKMVSAVDYINESLPVGIKENEKASDSESKHSISKKNKNKKSRSFSFRK